MLTLRLGGITVAAIGGGGAGTAIVADIGRTSSPLAHVRIGSAERLSSPSLLSRDLRTPAITIVPFGNAPGRLLTDALAGVAEDVLIDVLDPDALARRRVRDGDVDQIERRGLILFDELTAPQKIGEERLRAGMASSRKTRQPVAAVLDLARRIFEARDLDLGPLASQQHLGKLELRILVIERQRRTLQCAVGSLGIGTNARIGDAIAQIHRNRGQRFRGDRRQILIVRIDILQFVGKCLEKMERLAVIGIGAFVVGVDARLIKARDLRFRGFQRFERRKRQLIVAAVERGDALLHGILRRTERYVCGHSRAERTKENSNTSCKSKPKCPHSSALPPFLPHGLRPRILPVPLGPQTSSAPLTDTCSAAPSRRRAYAPVLPR